MKKVIHHIKSNKSQYLLATIFIVLGILIGMMSSLSIEAIRYTKYIEPKMFSVEPREAYDEMTKNPNGYLFIDVRTPAEYDNMHAVSSINIPIGQLFDQWHTLPRSGKQIYLICTTGRLAGVAYGYLQLHGFRNITHIKGGIRNWIDQGLPTVSIPVFVNPKSSLEAQPTSPCLIDSTVKQ